MTTTTPAPDAHTRDADPTALQARIASIARAINEAVSEANRQHALELAQGHSDHERAEEKAREYLERMEVSDMRASH